MARAFGELDQVFDVVIAEAGLEAQVAGLDAEGFGLRRLTFREKAKADEFVESIAEGKAVRLGELGGSTEDVTVKGNGRAEVVFRRSDTHDAFIVASLMTINSGKIDIKIDI